LDPGEDPDPADNRDRDDAESEAGPGRDPADGAEGDLSSPEVRSSRARLAGRGRARDDLQCEGQMVDIARASGVSRAPARRPGRLPAIRRLRRGGTPLALAGPGGAPVPGVGVSAGYILFDNALPPFHPR